MKGLRWGCLTSLSESPGHRAGLFLLGDYSNGFAGLSDHLKEGRSMDDETLTLMLALLNALGNNAMPREVEVRYLRAKEQVQEYRRQLMINPEQDPRR